MRSLAGVISVVIAALTLQGCAPVVVSYADAAANSEGGISYYLPKRLVKIQVDRTVAKPPANPPYADVITVTLLAPVADTSQRYVAVPKHLASRSDQLTLKTNAAGLLSNADATVTDQTAAIIVALAGAVSGANEVGFAAAVAPDTKTESECGGEYPGPPSAPSAFSAEYVLDPTQDIDQSTAPFKADSKPTTAFESLLCGMGAHYRFRLSSIGGAASSGDAALTEGAAGLFYRRELPYLLSIYAKPDNSTAPVLSKAVLVALPNKSPRELLRLDGAAFATRVFATVFENGVLVSHTETKPSELLSVAQIPIDVLKAIFSVPTELVTLKVNYTNKQKDLADAQKQLLDAALALEAAKKP
jgi:hypothetical protein